MNSSASWKAFLSPPVLRDRLISASLYITAYEMLRASIVERIRDFYMVGFDESGVHVSDSYASDVLSRNRSALHASLDWLRENEVIDQHDLEAFERVRSLRNVLAHRLPEATMRGTDFGVKERFDELATLLRKIEVWWVINVEIATDPELAGQDVDESEVLPGPMLMLNVMVDVINGNEEYLHHFEKEGGGSGGAI